MNYKCYINPSINNRSPQIIVTFKSDKSVLLSLASAKGSEARATPLLLPQAHIPKHFPRRNDEPNFERLWHILWRGMD